MSIKDPFTRKGRRETPMQKARRHALDKTGTSALEQQIENLTTENHSLKTELESNSKLARIDKLTQIGNRLSFGEELDDILKNLEEYKAQGKFPAVVLLDLDRFKGLNDDFGHDTGDEGLKAFAARMDKAMRRHGERRTDEQRISAQDRRNLHGISINDALFVPPAGGYRLGGDEFVAIIWIDAHSEEEANEKMALVDSRLKKATAVMSYSHKDKTFPLVTSMGAHLIENSDTAESAVKKADLALYAHKSNKAQRYEHSYNVLKEKGVQNLQYVHDHRGKSLENIPKYEFNEPKISFDIDPS